MTSDSLYLPNRSKFFKVKTCVEASVQMLQPTDRFGMIVFGTTQHILFGLTEMTGGAKQYASKILQKEFEIPQGGTDILGAMRVALTEMFKQRYEHLFFGKWLLFIQNCSDVPAIPGKPQGPV